MPVDQFMNFRNGSTDKFYGVFEMVAWLFVLKKQSQIVEMSEQNEF